MSSMEYQFRDTKLYKVTYRASVPEVSYNCGGESEGRTGKVFQEVRTKIVATNVTASRGYRWDLVTDAIAWALKQSHSEDLPAPEVMEIMDIGSIEAWVMR